jgi:hypothetical protein
LCFVGGLAVRLIWDHLNVLCMGGDRPSQDEQGKKNLGDARTTVSKHELCP